MNSLTRGVPLLLLLSTRSLSSITAGASSRRRRRGSLPNEKTIYNLTDQQVKKYYYLIKMIDHQHLYLINNTTTISSTTCSDRKLFDKINSEWRHKSQSDRIRLKEAFENIIYDMNQHKTIEIITTNDNNNDNDNNNHRDINYKEFHIMQYKYNQNQATGAIFSRKNLSSMNSSSILKYFIYSQINDENGYGNKNKNHYYYKQDNVTKLKIINEIKRKLWIKLSSVQKIKIMKQYYDLIMKGYEIDEKNDYQLIKITHDKFNIMTKAGEDDCFPITSKTKSNKVKYNTKWPTLIIKHNLTTGYCKIDGVSLLDGCNYYLWKNLQNLQNLQNCLNDYEKYQILKQNWINLNSKEQLQYQQEYENVLKSGKILLFGELKPITPKLIEESNVIKIKYTPIWGEQFKSVSYKNPVKLENLRFLINQTVGNIIVVGKSKSKGKTKTKTKNNLDYDYAWNYYLAKRLNQLGQNIDNVSDNYHLVAQEWGNMTNEEKSNIDKEYDNLLLSGKDYLNGEIVTIEKKISLMNNNQGKGKGKNLIHEIFGQDLVIPTKSRRGPGGYKVKTSIPVLIDQKSGKGIILDDIDLVYAYNYYLGLMLRKLGNGKDKDKDKDRLHHTVDNISQIENQWILMLQQEKLQYKSEYESLLRDGKDMLNGEIVSLREKFEANKTISSKISGQGLKRALFPKSNIDFTVKLISSGSGGDDGEIGQDNHDKTDKEFILYGELSDDKLYQYYKYHRLQELQSTTKQEEEEEDQIQVIESEWDEMNEQDKQEIQKAYELLLISGKDIKNNELIDIVN